MQLSSKTAHWPKLKNPIVSDDIVYLENTIDRLEEDYGLPDFFVTPGETMIGAALHLARTICRRAERRIITAVDGTRGYELIFHYVNRLSDLLFSLSWALETRTLVLKELKKCKSPLI